MDTKSREINCVLGTVMRPSRAASRQPKKNVTTTVTRTPATTAVLIRVRCWERYSASNSEGGALYPYGLWPNSLIYDWRSCMERWVGSWVHVSILSALWQWPRAAFISFALPRKKWFYFLIERAVTKARGVKW